ncbi:MAG: D-alanine--D-alanine ligase family protein [Eubacterium sp.]
MDNIGIIFGGKSTEHEVSLVSARSVAEAVNKDKHHPVLIGITKQGEWKKFDGPLSAMTEGNWEEYAEAYSFEQLKDLDLIFPVLHGKYGEDGTIQGLFEMLHVPYAGCGVLASSLAMDKAASKLIFESCGLPTPEFQLILREELPDHLEKAADRCEKGLKYPMFVKPANTGSSVGISKVRNRDELKKGILEAARFDRRIVVENGVDALEVETGVIGNDKPECAAVGSIQAARDFYDYTAKYTEDSGTVIQVPAKLDEALIRKVRETAVRAYQALDCAGCARVDFLLDKNTGDLYINELNTLPGFTSLSMFPMIWKEQGVGFTELIDRIIDYGYERFRDSEIKPEGYYTK